MPPSPTIRCSTGLLMILAGLGFKIAAFPFQIWAPDVYQGSPTSTTAFWPSAPKRQVLLYSCGCCGSRFRMWPCAGTLLMGMAAITILYGNLCALPQRNLKRLLGYLSIAHAGYLMMGSLF